MDKAIDYIYSDGGRNDAGYIGDADDCVTRAIAIATNKPYKEVYDELFDSIRQFKTGKSKAAKLSNRKSGRGGTSPRNGVFKKAYHEYIIKQGFEWIPTMSIGAGCTTHLKAAELPKGTIIVQVSKHLCAVIDGVIHDTYDPSRDGTRCVYGYYIKKS